MQSPATADLCTTFTFREEYGNPGDEFGSKPLEQQRFKDSWAKSSEEQKRRHQHKLNPQDKQLEEMGSREAWSSFMDDMRGYKAEFQADIHEAWHGRAGIPAAQMQGDALDWKERQEMYMGIKHTTTGFMHYARTYKANLATALLQSQAHNRRVKTYTSSEERLNAKLNAMFIKMSTPDNEHYNDWQMKHDDSFAIAHYGNITVPSMVTRAVQCCTLCGEILISDHGSKNITIDLHRLYASAERCDICNLILVSSVETADEHGMVQLYRSHEALRAGSGGKRLLRLSASPGSAAHDQHRIPVSYPITPENREARFNLLRSWLRQCDQSHICVQRRKTLRFPTRVLDVGGLEHMNFAPGWIRLVHAEERVTNDYIALSHRWGDLSEVQMLFRTSQSNLSGRQHGFHVSELPKTFQDAVKVVRAIGLRYLWIDSLCIIQTGDNGRDWDNEVTRMEDVFSEAYCVIAATAASDSHSGFLGNYTKVESFRIHGASFGQFCVSSDVDDYDQDVSKATINTRAWVMQESVLARRTIHFTSNQMYWECGKAIYCENLTRLKSPPTGKYFTMDPEFPIRVLSATNYKFIVNCLVTLYEDYSKRSVTYIKDRPKAVSGLENRITAAMCCSSRFCTIEKFLHRNLLWEGTSNGHRIQYKEPVPSWSWLSYSGPVSFWQVGALRPNCELNVNLAFNPNRTAAIDTDLGMLMGCWLRAYDENQWTIRGADGVCKGLLRFDVSGTKVNASLHCVVVARDKCVDPEAPIEGNKFQMYLVLVVVPTGRLNEFTRVGIGKVFCDWVIKVQDRVHIV